MASRDLAHSPLAVASHDGHITAEHLVHSRIASVHQQRLRAQRIELFLGTHDDEILCANSFDHPGTELLIAPAKDVTLATDGSDDDPGPATGLQQTQKLRLIQIGGQ